MKKVTVYGSYYAVKKCCVCKTSLSSNQQMYSRGICEFCGNNSNSTVVDTITYSVRYKKTYKTYFYGLIRIIDSIRVEYKDGMK